MRQLLGAGLLSFFIGTVLLGGSVLGLSSVGSCISVYGIDPAVIQAQGSPVSSSAYFAYETGVAPYTGFTAWAGPQSVGGPSGPPGYASFPSGSLTWGSAGPNPATWQPGFGWTNPSGGPLAVISWSPTFVIYKGTYYDLNLYLTGGCSGSTTPTQVQTTPVVSSTSIAAQQTMTFQQASTTVSTTLIGSTKPLSLVPLLPYAGFALIILGGIFIVVSKEEAI